MKFKKERGASPEVMDAALKRLKDIDNYDFGKMFLDSKCVDFIRSNNAYYPYIPSSIDIFNSYQKNLGLKNLKYFINLLNIRTERLEKENAFYSEYIYSLIKELENESLNLETLNLEKQMKFFYGSTFSSFNNFSKDSSSGLKGDNKDFLIDHKKKTIFKDKEVCSVIKNLGITLPILNKTVVPIVGIEIINEETTSGDTEVPLRLDNPMNLVERNSAFNYSVLFKKSDKKRMYPSEYAELTLNLELGAKMPVNSIKVSSSSITPFEVKEISYVDEHGRRIKVNEQSVENTFESNYIFKMIETDSIIIKFEQATPVGHSKVNSKIEESLNQILKNSSLVSGSSEYIEEIEGYVYDISLNEIEVNLLTFGEKGIYRSEYKEVSNVTSFKMKEASVIPSLISLRSSYLDDYLILSDEVLIEKYLGLKFFNSKGGILLDEVIPLIDNEYKQTEYLEPVGNEMRFKLFPMVVSTSYKNSINRISLIEKCSSLEKEDQPDIKESDVPVNINYDFQLSADPFSEGFTNDLVDAVNLNIETSIEAGRILDIITNLVLSDIEKDNIVETSWDSYLSGNGGYGVVDVKDFILDDSLSAENEEQVKVVPLNVYVGYEYTIDEFGKGLIKFIDPGVGFNFNYVNRADVPTLANWNIQSLIQNTPSLFSNNSLNFSFRLAVNTNRSMLLGVNTNSSNSGNSINSHNKSIEDLLYSDREFVRVMESDESGHCIEYYKVTFENKHNMKVGEEFDFYLPEENFYLRAIASIIEDEYSVLVPKSFVGSLSQEVLDVDLSYKNFHQVDTSKNNIEVFEEARKLSIGKDYLVSPDNGSNWYEEIPLDLKMSYIKEKASAGDFLIKLKNFDSSKLYIGKYFVSPYQSLSKSNKIVLKNKRIEIQSPLNESEGVVSSILVMRSGFKNKYLSPIVYEYTLTGYEDEPAVIKQGLKYNKNLENKKIRGSINVN